MTTTARPIVPAPLRPPDGTPASAGQDNPFATSGADHARRGGANQYGAFSIETFCNVGSLGLTHDDASGWLGYVSRFAAPNFWYQDAGVKVWAYEETYDDWQDTYGMDAVRAVYHSGHGGMDANGVFYVPMGAQWAGNDCTATSTTMRLGNEHARYVFWSTCNSLRVLDGQSPMRTWSAANLGLRMIFGFETTSYDDARYGSGFWNHWNRGESFSTAWLNSSWDIAHDQAPSASANGASAQEAQDRVFNERLFYDARPSTAWWWWRWYNVAASAVREGVRALPADPRVALLAPPDARSVAAVADRFGLDAGGARMRGSLVSLDEGDRRVDLGADGVLTATLSQPNRGNRTPIARREAIAAADAAVRAYGLDAEAPLVLDRIVDLQEAGASDQGDGSAEGPFTTGTLVQYRQVVNGLPVITPSAGAVRVTLDNDGTVTHLLSSARAVDELSDRPRSSTPPEPAPPGANGGSGAIDVEAALAQAFGRQLRALLVRGTTPVDHHVVPGTTEIGYDVSGTQGIVVARRAVEVEFERGYLKRYWVTAPLFG